MAVGTSKPIDEERPQMLDDDSLIRQQIEYYRERAAEYDEWFLRSGRYDRGEAHNRQWFAEVEILRDALDSEHPQGNVLELACGTGIWTTHLTAHAERLVAVDVSRESLEINRQRVADDRVDYVRADLFTWQPSRQFDFIFFAFWLSHIPASRFDTFWDRVHNALRAEGRVFFIDSLPAQEATARDHDPRDRGGHAVRQLNDGRTFEIVKIYYNPEELLYRLKNRGWHGYVRTTGRFFLYGCLSRNPSE
jgi:demethylmenaquinone methyltransferase/2-methoxy-6-polyprenyl-1,4-benzoquinol methylase